MTTKETILESLLRQGVSRRSFLKFCSLTASMLALPPGMGRVIAETLAAAERPSVIWLHYQECTACTESLTRSFGTSSYASSVTVENLILNAISLDYHETLMAAAGTAAETALGQTVQNAFGKYIVVVEGSLSLKTGYSLVGGVDNVELLQDLMQGAALVIAVGSCASFGGLPKAYPNPSDAVSVGELMDQGLVPQRPLVNISGCPPIAEVITGVIVHYLTFGGLPELDNLRRPEVFYREDVHDGCPRKEFFEEGLFAKSFDDEGARRGWCLRRLGCRGPETRNACAAMGWNQGTSFPVHSGHGCIGCAEPNEMFWDKPGGFYAPQRRGGRAR